MYEQARTLRHSKEDKEERREKKEELGEKKGGRYIPPHPSHNPREKHAIFVLRQSMQIALVLVLVRPSTDENIFVKQSESLDQYRLYTSRAVMWWFMVPRRD